VQLRQVRIAARRTAGIPKNLDRALRQLPRPVRDLVRVNVVLLRQLSQRLVALQRRQRLECRRVVPPRPSRHALAPVGAVSAAVQWGKTSTYPAVRISGATSQRMLRALLHCLANIWHVEQVRRQLPTLWRINNEEDTLRLFLY